ncbi:MAG TPA: hypothetical protein VGP00_06010 [Nocardioides sp.]|jgi:hypothetical protein|nr:hypothetical protein [Nocardioides sp.]
MTALLDVSDQLSLREGLSLRTAKYVALSRAYAARGEGRPALLAVWAADVQVLQVLLLESGLDSAPDPEAQMALVAEAVRGSLLEGTESATGPATLREAAERARAALLATFDESVHALVEERLAPLDHLDRLAPPASNGARQAVARRRAGRTSLELVHDLRTAAGDCMAIAHEMARDGDPVGARRQARNADLGSFEAYLVSAALAVGDTALTTVGLRWDLAEAADERDVDDLDEGVRALRERLESVVGPTEVPVLRTFFQPHSLSRW